MTMTAGQTMTLSDGRTLSYAEYGDPDGRPVVALHGTPGSRLAFEPGHAAASAAGVRLIAPERPGFGNSSAAELSFAGYAEDLRQLLDRLGLDTVVLAGVSGGGGYAIAAGLALPARFSAVFDICGMMPGAPASAKTGMSKANTMVFSLAARAPWLLKPVFARSLRQITDGRPGSLEKAVKAMPAADRDVVLSKGMADVFRADLEAATTQGVDAALAELRRYAVSPAFDFAKVTVPVHVIHGSADANVPLGIARWVAETVPGATLSVLEGAGHLFLLGNPAELLDRV